MIASTHDVTIGEDTVVKRYRSFDRGEPEREWHALSLLHHHCSDLAPEPLTFNRDEGVPTITMSRVPGVPLGSAPLTHNQVDAVADAISRLHHALPLAELARVGDRRSGHRELLVDVKPWSREPHAPVSPLVTRAMEAALPWLDGFSASDLEGSSVDPVFTLGDGNLGNFMWDGERCRLVDFEDSGLSHAAFEAADFVEHPSAWLQGRFDAGALLGALDFPADQQQALRDCRRLFAFFWLLMLLPGNPGHERNPIGSVDRQAARLLALLEAH